jgi:hypothetical protein
MKASTTLRNPAQRASNSVQKVANPETEILSENFNGNKELLRQ